MTRKLALRASILAACLVPALALAARAADGDATRTWRLDYYHTGNAEQELFSFDRLVVEPLPWPGHPAGDFDTTGAGKYWLEIRAGEEVRYSRGFASIYGEWETTGEARARNRTFHESLRFPSTVFPPASDGAEAPSHAVTATVRKRDAQNRFVDVWTVELDPDDLFVDTSQPPPQTLLEIERHGEPRDKVDVLLVGDGYTAEECAAKFVADARRMSGYLFTRSPFAERRADFNVWGLCPPAPQSGVSRPSTGIHVRSPVGASYDAFGSERYVLTTENRALRDVAAWAPYEFVEILVNRETYGGGGILNLYATVAADNDWAEYVFIHEFGHHFAGLADEYYTSDVAYEAPAELVEPWEANATAHPEALKWADLASASTPLPTPWPKAEFEAHSSEIRERRAAIRAQNRPESDMSALFREQMAFEHELLQSSEHAAHVGAFEGASYEAKGLYRPQIDCIMFSRNPVPFCAVCRRALEAVIDLYAPRTGADPASPAPSP